MNWLANADIWARYVWICHSGSGVGEPRKIISRTPLLEDSVMDMVEKHGIEVGIGLEEVIEKDCKACDTALVEEIEKEKFHNKKKTRYFNP